MAGTVITQRTSSSLDKRIVKLLSVQLSQLRAHTLDRDGRLIGQLSQGVLLEEAKSVGEESDSRDGIDAVCGRNRRRAGEQFLVMQSHLELVKVEPLTCFTRRQVVIVIPGRIAKRVKHSCRLQQQHSWHFRIWNPRVTSCQPLTSVKVNDKCYKT